MTKDQELSTIEPDADVVIVGAGIAGVTAASILARSGIAVTMIDRSGDFPDSFKAEKIESDQADLLRGFGLLDVVQPVVTRIRQVKTVRRDGSIVRRELEQYGGYYHDIVNRLRQTLDDAVDLRLGRVLSVETGATRQVVTLDDGTKLSARLVVLATGPTPQLTKQLGIGRNMLSERHSLSFGFSIARSDGTPFPFDSVNYYCEDDSQRLAYLTLFAFPNAEMRANLFTYWEPTDPAVRDFLRQPARTLERLLPRMASEIGEFRVETKVRSGAVDLYDATGHRQPGVVLIGDSFQRVCPAVGQGLSRALTDVDVLCRYVPQWLASDGMGADKIRQFYDDPVKREADRVSMSTSLYAKDWALGATVLARLEHTRAWGRLVAFVRQRRRLWGGAAWLYARVRPRRAT